VGQRMVTRSFSYLNCIHYTVRQIERVHGLVWRNLNIGHLVGCDIAAPLDLEITGPLVVGQRDHLVL
jgi:hypothetical protein